MGLIQIEFPVCYLGTVNVSVSLLFIFSRKNLYRRNTCLYLAIHLTTNLLAYFFLFYKPNSFSCF